MSPLLVLITFFTLVAFAANSLLCRMALGAELIDPASFTLLRLAGGALVLTVLVFRPGAERPGLERPSPGSSSSGSGSWGSGLALFTYAAAFSWAYLSLTTGTGALILFGAVQVTMIGAALKAGERLGLGQWGGFVVAISGFVYLVLPGLEAPDPLGAALMSLSGLAWGIYSLRGKGATRPVLMTAMNFQRAAALSLLLVPAVLLWGHHLTTRGVLLALTSGTVTSGLGYVLWYRALAHLSTTAASVLQLLVPVLAAVAGVLFLAEPVSLRLVLASVAILGGVGVVIGGRRR